MLRELWLHMKITLSHPGDFVINFTHVQQYNFFFFYSFIYIYWYKHQHQENMHEHCAKDQEIEKIENNILFNWTGPYDGLKYKIPSHTIYWWFVFYSSNILTERIKVTVGVFTQINLLDHERKRTERATNVLEIFELKNRCTHFSVTCFIKENAFESVLF